MVQRFARRWWRGDAGLVGVLLTVVLTPISLGWRLVAHARARRQGVAVGGIQVVSVGNLAVGGTGKTPVASWVTQRLIERGATPAIVLRGYGRDEALLHSRWTPNATVIVDPNRVEGVRAAHSRGADVAVLDDGFQHLRLDRAIDVVLLAVEDAFPGRVLPTGPYREGAPALRRADAIVLTRRSASPEAARAVETKLRDVPLSSDCVVASVHLATGRLRSLSGRAETDSFDSPYVLTAIARPDGFLGDVARLSRGQAELRAYRDHYDFTEADARMARSRAEGRPIVMTEKDEVKLMAYEALLGEAWVVEQDLTWDWGEEDILRLLDRVCEGGAP